MSHSKTPTECTVHDVLSVLCNAVVVQEATDACVSVVGVHSSVTTYRIIDPQPNFSRKLLHVFIFQNPLTKSYWTSKFGKIILFTIFAQKRALPCVTKIILTENQFGVGSSNFGFVHLDNWATH